MRVGLRVYMHSEAFLIYFVLLSEVVRRAVRYSFGALVATRVLGLVRFLRSGIEEGKKKKFLMECVAEI